jgi:catechol 2,3-dioxygenase-like lactoylglutathione lyase family enzyme
MAAPDADPHDRPILDQFNLVSADVEASVAFYRLLGLEIPDVSPDWQDRHRNAQLPDGIDLDFDSVDFARRWNQGWPKASPKPMGVLGFRLPTREAVDETFARLTAAGYRGQQTPYDAFWGARYAIVEDPDGNAVGLMSAADEAHRGPVPPVA